MARQSKTKPAHPCSNSCTGNHPLAALTKGTDGSPGSRLRQTSSAKRSAPLANMWRFQQISARPRRGSSMRLEGGKTKAQNQAPLFSILANDATLPRPPSTYFSRASAAEQQLRTSSLFGPAHTTLSEAPAVCTKRRADCLITPPEKCLLCL